MIARLIAVESLSANCASSFGAPKTSWSPGSPRISRRFTTGSMACAASRLDTPDESLTGTGPYMHDGAFPTLEAVVRHYNDVPLTPQPYDVAQLEPALRATYHGDAATTDSVIRSLDFRLRTPLHLSDAELADLVAFLKSLTDPSARDLSGLVPAAVPSGLPVPR